MFDYNHIMNGDWSHRVSLFNQLPPTEKAEFFRTHVRRWLEANRHRLSPEQIAAIEEQIAFVTPELYAVRRDPKLLAAAEELAQRAKGLFDRADLRDLTLHGGRQPG